MFFIITLISLLRNHVVNVLHVGLVASSCLKVSKKSRKERLRSTYLNELIKLADSMKIAAKCGLGQSVGNAFKSIVTNFREEIIY